MNNFEGTLGLAKRAGKVVSGDLIWESIRKKQAKLVVIDADIGMNTRKKLNDKCAFYGIEIMIAPRAQTIMNAIGQNRKAIAICDQGFANALRTWKGT